MEVLLAATPFLSLRRRVDGADMGVLIDYLNPLRVFEWILREKNSGFVVYQRQMPEMRWIFKI